MTKAATYQVSIQCPQLAEIEIEILKDVLLSLGIKPESIVESIKDKFCVISVFFKTSKQALGVKRQLLKLNLKDIEVSYQSIKNRDWQSIWKKDFKPFQLTPKFRVIPEEHRRSQKVKFNEVYIDTSIAFGTGLHATTRFMAGFVERMEGKFESFLDLGTGTGILSIVAAKCGAQKIDAIDISADAIKVAQDNFDRNDMSINQLKAIGVEKFKTKKQYDYVAANLITHDLMDNAKVILGFVRPEKYLAVSGISLDNYPLFRKVFDKLPLKCLKIEKGEGWVAILYKKKK